MKRLRSPSYPAYSVGDAVDYIKKIYDLDRQHPVPRDVAVQHLGFSGVSGTSDRALAALLHFGLAEKVATGEIRVADLALRILHPDNEVEYRSAINEAAFRPQLFQELRKRYPGRPPAAANVESHLARLGFAPIAIGPASRAFLETCRILQQAGAYEVGPEEVDTTSGAPAALVPVEELPTHHRPTSVLTSIVASSELRSDIFTLQGGGEIIAKLPETMSQRDFDDLKDWLDLMRRKAERKIVKSESDQSSRKDK